MVAEDKPSGLILYDREAHALQLTGESHMS